jgi:hypothetical protein
MILFVQDLGTLRVGSDYFLLNHVELLFLYDFFSLSR